MFLLCTVHSSTTSMSSAVSVQNSLVNVALCLRLFVHILLRSKRWYLIMQAVLNDTLAPLCFSGKLFLL